MLTLLYVEQANERSGELPDYYRQTAENIDGCNRVKAKLNTLLPQEMVTRVSCEMRCSGYQVQDREADDYFGRCPFERSYDEVSPSANVWG